MISTKDMTQTIKTPIFYVLKEEGFETIKHLVEPLKSELNDALNSMKWGMKKGIVSLTKETRTSTLYWEL
tara:strand:+ start:381 stop:590 length:210 start_codon:yes stop_codon:yes gene_type:complete